MGFNALIHSHRPDLIDFSELQPQKHIDNLNNAFDIAHSDLGIPKLLDAEGKSLRICVISDYYHHHPKKFSLQFSNFSDVDTNRPDEKSIMTYVASYYHTFARMKNEKKSGRRIANVSASSS